jgi:hypothetical protein
MTARHLDTDVDDLDDALEPRVPDIDVSSRFSSAVVGRMHVSRFPCPAATDDSEESSRVRYLRADDRAVLF